MNFHKYWDVADDRKINKYNDAIIFHFFLSMFNDREKDKQTNTTDITMADAFKIHIGTDLFGWCAWQDKKYNDVTT